LPQATVTVSERFRAGSHAATDTGVALESLVESAQPTLHNAKNALLRVTVTVAGRDRAVTFALGELDAAFGDHPAYLALTQNGRPLPAPELVVPGDTNDARTVRDARHITVSVQSAAPTTPSEAGDLAVEGGGHTRVLSASELASMPARTLQVSFQAGTAPQTHTETGPTLQTVLRAAHLWSDLDTWVAAVGSDGYVAVVTPAEAWVGGRPLLVSLSEDGQALAQPRLVVDGDVKGGRYVSGVVDLVVGHALSAETPWWRRR
jgi:hypothetical protein